MKELESSCFGLMAIKFKSNLPVPNLLLKLQCDYNNKKVDSYKEIFTNHNAVTRIADFDDNHLKINGSWICF